MVWVVRVRLVALLVETLPVPLVELHSLPHPRLLSLTMERLLVAVEVAAQVVRRKLMDGIPNTVLPVVAAVGVAGQALQQTLLVVLQAYSRKTLAATLFNILPQVEPEHRLAQEAVDKGQQQFTHIPLKTELNTATLTAAQEAVAVDGVRLGPQVLLLLLLEPAITCQRPLFVSAHLPVELAVTP